MPPQKPGKARKRPQAEASCSPSPSRPAKRPKLSASPPPSPEEKKARKSNKPDEGFPGWWPPEYAPAGKPLSANEAGMRKLWSEGGLMVQLARQDPVGRIHQRIFDKIDFENLVPKIPSQTQREEVPSSEDEQATLDTENTEPTPEPLVESITIAETSVLKATESTSRQPQNTDIAKPMSATIDTLRNGDGLVSHDVARSRQNTRSTSRSEAQHIAFFIYNQDENQWALCHLEVGKATLVSHLTNHLTRVPAEELVDCPNGGIYSLVFLRCLMAKERVPRRVDIGATRMEFNKMIGLANADENMATKVLTSAQDGGLNGETIPTGMPKDQAIPVDPKLQALSSECNPAQVSSHPEPVHAKQDLSMSSPCPIPKKPEQTVLISSSESSPKPTNDEDDFEGPTGDEEANSKSVDTASTDNSRESETNTPLSDPDDPLTVAQSLEANFTAFLNQRCNLKACVKAEKSSAKKNDETIAELKQAQQELIKKHSRSTYELRCKVSELEIHLEAVKGALVTAERAENESDARFTELEDKIQGEERSKAEAAERIKKWEATLAKTAFQSM
ncbi:hypothetical protein FACUT_1538 [Fusarium acutatum]|uniref:Uncharacterized protein n=1 Tax=Fusarium acutatum TaxID=78861 RepID=A0A8H4K1K0_9HYPO|nr:hypothetical protein FACUT_1538 [Fusarium acutatum]